MFGETKLDPTAHLNRISSKQRYPDFSGNFILHELQFMQSFVYDPPQRILINPKNGSANCIDLHSSPKHMDRNYPRVTSHMILNWKVSKESAVQQINTERAVADFIDQFAFQFKGLKKMEQCRRLNDH